MSALVAGRYALREEIGSGATATVHRAYDEVLGRHVAVKLLRPGARPDAVEDLLHAAVLAASVRHPHVVGVHDAGPPAGGDPAFCVMDLVAGTTMSAWLATRPEPVAPIEAARVADDVLAALEALHAAGIVHGDLSPGNVLVDAGGRAVLIDVGGGVRRRATTTVRGTPGFIPPERHSPDAETSRSDLYSAGCLMHLLLVGHPPFVADDEARVAALQATRSAPSVAALRPDLSPALAALVQRCLARDPHERPASAAEARGLLTAALGDPASAEVPTSATARPLLAAPPPRSTTREIALGGHSRQRVDRIPRRRRPPRPARAGVATGLLLVGALLGATARGLVDPTPVAARAASAATAHVPAVRGLSPLVAGDRLSVAGLTAAGSRPVADARVRSGTVVGTDPAAGSPVAPGQAVTLLVSSGPATAAVPPVAGLELRAARAALTAAGLTLGELTRRDGPSAADVVVAAVPGAGSPVARGTAVDLAVASGATTVPSLVGLGVEQATRVARAAGLELTVRSSDAPGGRPGTVTAQGAPERTRAQVGSRVTVWVAAVGAGAAPTPSPDGSSTPTPSGPEPTPSAGMSPAP